MNTTTITNTEKAAAAVADAAERSARSGEWVTVV